MNKVTLSIDDMYRWAGDPHRDDGEDPCDPDCDACKNWAAWDRLMHMQEEIRLNVLWIRRNGTQEQVESLDYPDRLFGVL